MTPLMWVLVAISIFAITFGLSFLVSFMVINFRMNKELGKYDRKE